MAVYSVFEPPARKGDGVDHAERFRFVRDGFSWGAFLFGPLWMLRHRLWLVLLLYVVLIAALSFGFLVLRVADGAEFMVAVLLAVLIGFEAATLRRWTLQRRGWNDLGIVVADDLQSAERRFFDDWIAGEFAYSPPPAAPVSRQPSATQPLGSDGPDVIGLFPRPETNR